MYRLGSSKTKRKMKRIGILVLIIAMALQISAQNIAQSKADELFRLTAYSEAIDAYKKLLNKRPGTAYYIQQIAYSYDRMGQYKPALEYYQQHIENPRVRYEDQFRYGMLLLIDQQFILAVNQFNKCMELNPNDERPAAQIARIADFERLNLLQLVDTVICESFNTRFADMSPAFFKDSIAYVSARDSSGNNTYSWNNEPFLDIYEFGVDKKGNPGIVKMPGVNTKYHEGPLVFTNNDETIWFTRNNQKFTGASQEQTSNLRIYTGNWDGKKWKGIKDFQYNSNEYSVGHPTFSLDGNTMYFASNMDTSYADASYGATDLFKVIKVEQENKKGEIEQVWSKPINMGKQFNTEGSEMFPFIDERGVLFFSSNGKNGFGGLDIFAAFPVADSFNVINLGQPINSTYDDFGFIVRNKLTEGYFTSNRPGGVGSDDIYSFNIGVQRLQIHVKSLKTNQPVAEATINYTVDGETSIAGETDENGVLWMDVDFQKKYLFEATNSGFIANGDSLLAYEIFKLQDHQKTIYLDNASQLQILAVDEENGDPLSEVEVILNYNGREIVRTTDAYGKIFLRLDDPGTIDIEFHKEDYVSQNTSVEIDRIGFGNFSASVSLLHLYEGRTITLEKLYYDVNSSLIRPDAALILDELYDILVETPAMTIELSSHTDCRARNEYNQWLSQKRAQSAVEYLVSKGINKDRMIAVGYGENKLLNHCADGVECSEEEHQVNRRTEFKILEF